MPNPATRRSELETTEKDRYTYEDYRQLPEGAPYELLGGHLVMAPAPSLRHQRVLRRLVRLLDGFVTEREAGEVFFAPVDVHLSDEDVVQPDLVVVTPGRAGIVSKNEIGTAPDFVCEVLSASTAHRDLTQKKRLYEEHNVSEYWIVDPDQHVVEIFQNTEDGFIQHDRVVEHGTVSSALLDRLEVGLEDIF